MSDNRHLTVLGVRIRNYSLPDALGYIHERIERPFDGAENVFIVNAHTLNLAAEDLDYRAVLNGANIVFADGTGVRWAAKMRGVKLKANLVGTDLVPAMFDLEKESKYRVFLLGADRETIARAARHCAKNYPKWAVAGYHDGYVNDDSSADVIKMINAAKPDVLLVGMGNPLQERWLHEHQSSLEVPICVGVGGLFDHWGGNLKRAPSWVRNMGLEWLQILMQQPGKKWRRYLLGNPKFIFRVSQSRSAEVSQNKSTIQEA